MFQSDFMYTPYVINGSLIVQYCTCINGNKFDVDRLNNSLIHYRNGSVMKGLVIDHLGDYIHSTLDYCYILFNHHCMCGHVCM